MSEWILSRPPQASDANTTGNILVSVGDSVPEISWDAWTTGQPWMRAPDPYVPTTNRRSWWLTAENCYAIEYFEVDPDFDLLMTDIDRPVDMNSHADLQRWAQKLLMTRKTPHPPKSKTL